MAETNLYGDLCGDDENFSTCDLYLSAFLLSAGCRMSSSSRLATTKRVYFFFEKSPMIMELKMKYFSREAAVDALTYADNIKSLKSLCHNIINVNGTAR
jgi:uncharacterized protein YfiM (DUF2279 family)